MSIPTPAPAPRLRGPDALRAVATVAVIVIHASAWPYSPGTFGRAFYDDVMLLARFAVPAFVLLTGLVLAYSYRDRPLGRGFLARRLRRSLIPWLVWAPIYFAFGWSMNMIPHDWTSIIEWWKEGGGHLYFLLLVPQFYVLFLIWPRRHRWETAATLLAVQTAICIIRLWVPFDSLLPNYVTIWYGYLLFPYWMGYFAIGAAIAGEIQPRRPILAWTLATAGTIVSAAILLARPLGSAARADYAQGTGGFLVPWMPLFAAGLALLILMAASDLMRKSARLGRVVTILSDNSLGIYIVHPIILNLLGPVVGGVLFAPFLLAIPGFTTFVVIVLVLALLTTRVLVRTPLAITLGVQRQAWRGPPTKSWR